MSIRIALDSQPEFYTNLDHVAGRIVLALNRAEQVGSIVVKLEGEAVTALKVPDPYNDGTGRPPGPMPGPPGSVVSENHKILYKVQQVFPDEYHSSSSNPYGAFPLQPGEHEFPFKFKLPINNACSDPQAMSRIGGLAGVGGFGSGGGLFGMGGVRVMDGSKQLFLQHVTRTLPPSLTGYPNEAEIRYYIKVTVQRPGFLKENWRFQVGFKFLPIEPPRPAVNGQEAFARRPFTFRARTPTQPEKKRSGFFSRKTDKGAEALENGSDGSSLKDDLGQAPAPSVEMSARLPHPPVLTCNQPIPLRLIAKKLVNSPEQVYLVSFQMDLIGITEVRSHNIFDKKINRWVVVSTTDLSIPLTSSPQDEVGNEVVIPDELWRNRPLPNTVAPSFVACNLRRRYELELKIGLAWGKPKSGMLLNAQPLTIFLPLHFAQLEVYSGITPPRELLQAARNTKPGRVQLPPRLPLEPRSRDRARPPLPDHHNLNNLRRRPRRPCLLIHNKTPCTPRSSRPARRCRRMTTPRRATTKPSRRTWPDRLTDCNPGRLIAA
ncbi:arrestin [Purpureocillium lavendulum]|uniref:Arrestin n=1 Tax=Purpureocillium lavendulum TaxID=1247861 RepID=A0AB34FVJ4_9HYPO|nr:arrestin [Purpureocillium lavendulum]